MHIHCFLENSPGEAPNNCLKPDELPEINPAILSCKADASVLSYNDTACL
ncbi:hypothetical protein MPL3356_280032 [Mesorhizobium plurifarium]|jgi:hypothetical protein|uniref:Uncharacterized protein n=1 Tax=Mesorhizobium plurifarium TaxID=69974 RepID=A0A090DUX2_MESPL|nr:hypothetical protein MPL3356_280032 [Mesorhizobium plurifarium]CDX30926.1 hypothetical protein MPLDJ20_140097 [Mesorhizobium plurifarium]